MITEHSTTTDRAEELFDQGMERWWGGDHEAAVRLFRRVLRHDPQHADAHNHLGIALLDAGRPRIAERHFRAAVEAGARAIVRDGARVPWGHICNRPFLRSLGNLAIALRVQRRYGEALAIHQELLHLNPGDHQGVRYLIGEELLRVGDYQGAITAYRATCGEEPGSAFGLALASLLAFGRKADVGEALLLGFAANRTMAPLLLGEPWERLDAWYGTSMAEPEWALSLVQDQGDLWHSAPGALEVLRWWWSAAPVRAWRAKLDQTAVELRGLRPSPERTAVAERALALRHPETVRQLVRAVQALSRASSGERLDTAAALRQAPCMSDHVRVEPVGQRIRVRLGGEPIVETERAFVVHERGLPPRYYVPREDVRAKLQQGQGEGTCPWKGRWHHLDVSAPGKSVANGAWTYFETTPVCEPIRDFVSFYADKMDAVEIG